MSIILSPQRYSRVSWLWQADLEEGRRALWCRDLESRGERMIAWAVTTYEDRSEQESALVVYAKRGNGNDGGVITLSIQDIGAVAVKPKPFYPPAEPPEDPA